MISAAIKDKATLETVIEIRHWTDSLFSFRTTRPAEYDFTPGQYARLGLPADDNAVWRAYSVVSAPHEDFLEYYGILVPGGAFTTRMKVLKPGDAIWTEKERYGFMTASRFGDGEELWMIATGTGLGPYVSMLRDAAVWNRFSRLVLVHGVRHASELGYADELEALQQTPPPGATARLQVIQATTRDDPAQSLAAGRLHGRIPALLDKGELEAKAGLMLTPERSRVMLCGNPDMIEEMRRKLHDRGMRPCRRALPGQFVTENYW